MVDGDPQAAGARLHRRLRRPQRSVSRSASITAASCAISFAGYWWIRTASSIAFRRRRAAARADRRPDPPCWSAASDLRRFLARAVAPLGSSRSHRHARSIRSAVWGKMICTRAAISTAMCAPRAPKKLRMSGVPNAFAAAAEFDQPRIPREACCCRSTITISRARTPTICAPGRSNTSCAAPIGHAPGRPVAASRRALR